MSKYVTREQTKRWQEIDDQIFESRQRWIEKEVRERLEQKLARLTAQGKTDIPVADLAIEIKNQIYQEQADRDRKYDEYEKATWGH